MHCTMLNRYITRFVAIAALALTASVRATTANPPTPLISFAAELGLTPESLVVAGITSNGASTILARLEYAEELREDFHTAQVAWAAAAGNVRQIAAALSMAPSDEVLLSQHAGGSAALLQSHTQMEAVLQQLMSTLLDGFQTQQVELLAKWRASAGIRVPAHFRIAERTPEEWKIIEVALRSEKRAQRTGATLDPALADALATIRAESDVIAAQYQLTVQLATMQEVFHNFEGS